jgi:hypothetical protein
MRTDRGNLFVTDTRGATPAVVPLPSGADETLVFFQQPRRAGDLSSSIASDIEELLARRFIVSHEGLLLSVVVHDKSVTAASRLHAGAIS